MVSISEYQQVLSGLEMTAPPPQNPRTNFSTFSFLHRSLFHRNAVVRLERLKLPAQIKQAENKAAADDDDVAKLMTFSEVKKFVSNRRVCKICQSSPDNIISHVGNCHNINVLQYFKLYHQPPNSWIKGCLFKCKLCDFLTCCQLKLSRHLYGKHKLKTAADEKKFDSSSYFVKSFIRCPQCSMKLLHDFVSIKNHVKEHELTLQKFATDLKAMLSNGSKIHKNTTTTTSIKELKHLPRRRPGRPKKRSSPKNSFNGFLSNGTSTRPSKAIVYDDDHDNNSLLCNKLSKNEDDAVLKEVRHLVFGNEQKEDNDMTLKAKENDVKDVSYDWINCCTLECPECSLLFRSSLKLNAHLNSTHADKDWKNQAHHCRIITKYHKCYICDKLIVCDEDYIMGHLDEHFITIEFYHNKFMKNSPKDDDDEEEEEPQTSMGNSDDIKQHCNSTKKAGIRPTYSYKIKNTLEICHGICFPHCLYVC